MSAMEWPPRASWEQAVADMERLFPDGYDGRGPFVKLPRSPLPTLLALIDGEEGFRPTEALALLLLDPLDFTEVDDKQRLAWMQQVARKVLLALIEQGG